MVLSLLFGWEGYKMLRWAGSKEFTGGCCEHCRITPGASGKENDVEINVLAAVKDKCDCCSESEKGSCNAEEVPGGDATVSEVIFNLTKTLGQLTLFFLHRL